MSIKRTCLFGLPINITTLDEIKNHLLNSTNPMQVVTINPEMITKSYKDTELSQLIKNADVVVPDGIGVVIALKMVGIRTSRIPGIELSYALLKEAEKRNLTVALIGADEDTIQKAKNELLKDMPNLNFVYVRNGYFNKDEENVIIQDLAKLQPDLLFAGLGFPKQEKFLESFKKYSKNTIMIGVGGSFDVWAKKLKRAPLIFQKLYMEWFYRLLCQPSRFRRMFPSIPLFLLRVIIERKLHRKKY